MSEIRPDQKIDSIRN